MDKEKSNNFIEEIINKDLENNKNESKVPYPAFRLSLMDICI